MKQVVRDRCAQGPGGVGAEVPGGQVGQAAVDQVGEHGSMITCRRWPIPASTLVCWCGIGCVAPSSSRASGPSRRSASVPPEDHAGWMDFGEAVGQRWCADLSDTHTLETMDSTGERPGPADAEARRRPAARHESPRLAATRLARDLENTTARAHSAPKVSAESRNRCRDAAISASACDRPTHSAPSTLLPGSRSL